MNKQSSKLIVLAAFALVIYIFFVFIITNNYKVAGGIIISGHDAKVQLVEESIHNETKYSEIVSKIAEKEVQNDMEHTSHALVRLYKKNNDVFTWDLATLKSEHGGFDIYLINEDLEVVASTLADEVGMTFEKYPQFSETLRNRLAGDRFRSDSINFSFQEKELKKFSYMPTPDNKYLVELSVNIRERYPELENLDVLYLSETLLNKYDFIKRIRVYKYDMEKGTAENLFKDPERTGDALGVSQNKELVRQAMETLEPQMEAVAAESGELIVKYIPYYLMNTELRMNWWGTYLIEIVYDCAGRDQLLSEQRRSLFGSLILVSLLYFGFLVLMGYTIKKNREMSHYDCLTQIPNRRSFEEYMHKALTEARRKKEQIAIYFFDLNDFKAVNDQYGHDVGDEVLRITAERLLKQFPTQGIVARLGGDEFIGAIPAITGLEEAENYKTAIYEEFEKPIVINGREHQIAVAAGISIYPEQGSDIETLLLAADRSMYKEKKQE